MVLGYFVSIAANTVDEYIEAASVERQGALRRMRAVFRGHLPEGFEERLGYGMPAFAALYHMGLYASPDDMAWFKSSWDVKARRKLHTDKSCIRFKNMTNIPWSLLEQLASRMTPSDWIARYESAFKSKS